MKKILAGLFVAPFAMFFNNVMGVKTVVQTTAALQTVNGGGMDYQLARSIATMPNFSMPLIILSGGLIVWGVVDIFKRKRKAQAAASAKLHQDYIDAEAAKKASL